MNLDFIPLDRLIVGKTNMRTGRKAPDIADLLPSVRKRGVLVPLIVRPDPTGDRFEIVAGRRRHAAATIVAAETGTAEPLPAAIIAPGDDADALEASLLENIARLDPDEVTQWESFVRLVREGRRVEDIAVTFGLPKLAVRRVLALGNLLPAIRTLYREQAIDVATVRHLTMASKSQQKAWLALANDPDSDAPTGHQLKAWLFGGQSIAARHALFDVDALGLATIADLFGEDRYVVDADAFWTAQNEAVAAKRAAYLAAGWADAIIVPPSGHFATWEYVKAGKRKGGRVYLDVRASGEVIVHDGYVAAKEAARIAKAGAGADRAGESETEAGGRVNRPEVTSTLQTYLDLHRHAAVRAALVDHPAVALRLMLAHAIAGSHLWVVCPEPQATRHDAVRESVETAPVEAAFDARRRDVLAVLGFSAEEATVIGGDAGGFGLVGLFARLLRLPDADVMAALAIVMSESLAAGSTAVEAVAIELGVDMVECWRADDAFFDLIRDRDILTRIVAEIAGESIAEANAGEPGRVLKAIIRDHLDGSNGRPKSKHWVPRWLAAPPATYTTRGGVATVAAHATAQAARDAERPAPEPDDDPDPSPPGTVIALPVPPAADRERLAA